MLEAINIEKIESSFPEWNQTRFSAIPSLILSNIVSGTDCISIMNLLWTKDSKLAIEIDDIFVTHAKRWKLKWNDNVFFLG